MVSSKLFTGVLALLSVGAANGKVCYPTRSTTLSTTAETTTSTAESSTVTESSTAETTTSSSIEISSSSTTESSSVETTTASTTDSSSAETTTSSATESTTATSTVSTDATTTATTSSAETSSTYITITSTTASSTEAETETASTSTSTFFPAGLFPCQNDADCDLRGGVCDPMRCGCINLMCYLKTTTMATMTTTALPEFACGSDTQCVGASFCLDQGVNVCACVNALCIVTQVPLP